MPTIKEKINSIVAALDATNNPFLSAAKQQVSDLGERLRASVPDDPATAFAGASESARTAYQTSYEKLDGSLSALEKAIASKKPTEIINSASQTVASFGDLQKKAESALGEAKAYAEQQALKEREALENALGAGGFDPNPSQEERPSADASSNEAGDRDDQPVDPPAQENADPAREGAGAPPASPNSVGASGDVPAASTTETRDSRPQVKGDAAYGSLASEVFKNNSNNIVEGLFGLPSGFDSNN